jgi:hypothetical protein
MKMERHQLAALRNPPPFAMVFNYKLSTQKAAVSHQHTELETPSDLWLELTFKQAVG